MRMQQFMPQLQKDTTAFLVAKKGNISRTKCGKLKIVLFNDRLHSENLIIWK